MARFYRSLSPGAQFSVFFSQTGQCLKNHSSGLESLDKLQIQVSKTFLALNNPFTPKIEKCTVYKIFI